MGQHRWHDAADMQCKASEDRYWWISRRTTDTSATAEFDPDVWSGRASQEGSSSWLSGLASMYPASDWSSMLRAIMDISARAI